MEAGKAYAARGADGVMEAEGENGGKLGLAYHWQGLIESGRFERLSEIV